MCGVTALWLHLQKDKRCARDNDFEFWAARQCQHNMFNEVGLSVSVL
jgi:hypothetical protein